MQGSAENTAEIRSLNKKKIIDYLRRHPRQTRRQISDGLNLSFATISNLSSQMIADGILYSESSSKSKGGRIPGLISLSLRACCTLCIDLSKQDCARVSVLNLYGKVISDRSLPNMEACSYEDTLQSCHQNAMEMIAAMGMCVTDLIGIGVAVPGIMDLRRNVIVNSTYTKLEHRPLASDLEQLFGGLPCHVGNETNLMALAIRLDDPDNQNTRDMIYLYGDEGLGIGIMCGGNLIIGAHGFGGEINHWPLGTTRAYACYCGRTGCLETELSTSGFLRKYQDAHPERKALSWNDFVNAVTEKDEVALAVVAENGCLLGRLLTGLNGLFDPQTYWLGGCIVDIYPYILPFIQTEMRRGHTLSAGLDIPIHRSNNYEILALLGCEEMVFSHWYP